MHLVPVDQLAKIWPYSVYEFVVSLSTLEDITLSTLLIFESNSRE